MMQLIESEVLMKMLEPIKNILNNNIYSRECPVLDDETWIRLGVLKTLSNNDSGRAYLEQIVNDCEDYLSLSHLFETLKSQRRLNYCQETNAMLVDLEKNKTCQTDPFAEFPELDDFDIYAGDGHHHGAPVHERKVMDKVYSTQHFYSLNLRNLMLSHLKLAEYGGTRKKEHDMRALKSLTKKELRQGAKKGRKVLYIWDKAGVDFYQWHKWKNEGGIYFLSLEKELNRLLVIGEPLFSKDDPVNFGVINDEMTSSANGVSVRRVTYQCPETGKIFKFLTNLPYSIRPGVVAFLYKHRWDIEKKFNSFKHKLYERKAWGTSENAKNMQAAFICLTYISHPKKAKNISLFCLFYLTHISSAYNIRY